MPGFNIVKAPDGREQTGNRVETIREHRWSIRTLGFKGAGRSISSLTDIIAKEVTLPNIEFETQEIIGGLVHYKFAKSMKVGTFSLSFYESLDTFKTLKRDWHDRVGTIEEGIKGHDEYKKTVIIDLLDGTGQTVYSVKFNGAWPKSLELGTLSYESSQIKLINITCEFDFLTETFEDPSPKTEDFSRVAIKARTKKPKGSGENPFVPLNDRNISRG